LVREFYDRVAADPALLGLYPEPDDLEPARERLWLFLGQYFGGPTTYSDQRGHPRLRARHHPYLIDPAARDRWLAAMRG
ncbi:globin domain-containing protein, partial [Aeromonas caviae]|nr:globin [Aeromonas caviae]